MAPEIVKLKSKVNDETILTNPFKCDIYSVGISILHLIYPKEVRLCEIMLQENNEDRTTFGEIIQEIKKLKIY